MFAILKPFLKFAALPALVAALFVNTLLPEPNPETSEERIQLYTDTEQWLPLAAEYHRLIEGDNYKLAYHRGYLQNLLKVENKNRSDGNRDEDLVKYYAANASSSDSRVADVGHYGLGYMSTLRDATAAARIHYEQIADQSQPFVSNSIGYTYLREGQLDQAESYFRLEILNRGNLGGAYSNLGRIYMSRGESAALDALVQDTEARPHLSRGLIRSSAFLNRQPLNYLPLIFEVESVDPYGLIAAALICAAWFLYLRRVDVFEPEPMGAVLFALGGGMAFSLLTAPLYDWYNLSLGLNLSGGLLDDLLFCIGGIGLIEETVKIIPALLVLRFAGVINESVDYIIYGSVSALGFAFVENLLYFDVPGYASITARAITAVPFHMVLTAFAMYGLARFAARGRNRRLLFLRNFAIACIVHGLYDYPLLADGIPSGLAALTWAILVCTLLVYSRMIVNALNHSDFFPRRARQFFDLTNYLAYVLTAIILGEYLLVAFSFGPSRANLDLGQQLFTSWFVIAVILTGLGRLQLKRKDRQPLFELG